MTHLRKRAAVALLSVLCALTAPALAQPAVSLTSASGHPGEEMEMAVLVQGLDQVTAVQMNIPLPQGVSYVENSATAGGVVSASHQLQVTQTGQELKIYVYSLQLDALQGGQGPLVSFRLLAGGLPGNYPLTPSVVLSNAQGGNVTAGVTAGSVTVLSPAIALSVKDIDFGQVPIRSTHTRSVVATNTGNEPLALTAAECSDAEVTVASLPCTIQPGGQQNLTVSYAPTKAGETDATVRILSDAANGTQTIRVKALPYSVNELLVKTTAEGSDGQIGVSVEMRNMEPIVAVQCVFALPDALQFAEGRIQMNASRAQGHLLSSSCTDGMLKVYIHSASNAALTGNEGELFSFRVQSIGASGNYTLSPTKVVLSNANGQNMLSGTQDATVHLSAPHIEAAGQIDFGAQPMDKEIKFSYPVRNTGETPLTISRIEIDNPAITVSTTLPLTIAAGATRNLEIVYQPEQEGPFEGIMQLYCDDPDQQMLVVSMAGSTYYDNRLSLSGVERAGGQFALTVSLHNTLPITALQADVHWNAAYTLRAEDITLSDRAGNHQVALSQVSADTYRLFVYSADNQPIAAGDGALLTLIYNKVEPTMSAYGTTITASHIILSTPEGKDQASLAATTLVVGKKGDVNADGLVTVADVTAVVDVLLERQVPAGTAERADINGDGRVSIIDVVEAIQLVLNDKH